MKVIVLLAGFGTRMRPHTWSRPKALMNVAGNTVLGHLLYQMRELLTDEVIFVVGYRGAQIQAWVEETYPEMDAHFVVQEQALGQAHAVAQCRRFLQDDSEVVLAFGDGIVKADYGAYQRVAGDTADAVLTYKEIDDPRSFGVMVLDDDGYVNRFIEKPETVEHNRCAVGINWFRSGRQLMDAIDQVMDEGRQTKGEYYMADVYGLMLEQGVKMRSMPVEFWFDGGQPANILHTNARMLGLGYGSENAIERGYGEGFVVIPPVYIAESADIEASVIGPYVHLDEGCVVRRSVLSNTIVDPNAVIEGAILDQALVGEEARVAGRPNELFVGDRSQVNL